MALVLAAAPPETESDEKQPAQLHAAPAGKSGTRAAPGGALEVRSVAVRSWYELQGSCSIVELVQAGTCSVRTAQAASAASDCPMPAHLIQAIHLPASSLSQQHQLGAPLDAATSSSSSSAPMQQRKRQHRWLTRLLVTAAAAALSTGAGVLLQRLQHLETRCEQVTHTHQELQAHTSSLTHQCQHLDSSVTALQQQTQALAAADQALAADVADLAHQQGQLAQGQAQVLQQVAAVAARQAALDGLAERLQQDLGATALALDARDQQQQHKGLEEDRKQVDPTCAATTGAAAGLSTASRAAVATAPTTTSSSSGSNGNSNSSRSSRGMVQAGDLHIQLTIPGFTEVLVDRVTDSQLVPAVASALVHQVKASNLIPHAAGAVVAHAGQKVSGALNPANWPWPWRQRRGLSEDS